MNFAAVPCTAASPAPRRSRCPRGLIHGLLGALAFIHGLPGLLVLSVLIPTPSPGQEVDWKGPMHHGIRNVLDLHYERRLSSRLAKTHCSAADGELCFGGDHEDTRCLDMPACRWPRDIAYFADEVTKAARKRTGDPQTIAQAVYALTRLGRYEAAIAIAGECTAAAWWCELVFGTALHRSGEEASAELHFRAGLRDADPELACKLTAIDEFLVGRDERVYEDLSCDRRMEFAERFWWLADPLLTDSGNDRWSEHINRRFELLLHRKLVWAIRRERHPRRHETDVVRRGFEDSWSRSSRTIRKWTSYAAARYRFTPVTAVSEGLHTLRYDLEPGEWDEGYTPPDYGSFFEMPAQFARFREGDSMFVAAAGRIDETPLDPTGVSFVASEGPGSLPFVTGPSTGELRPLFTALFPSVPLLVGIEAVDARGTVARARGGLPALDSGRVTLSDPLLVRFPGVELPGNRDEAVAAMRGKTTIERGNEMQVYWEVYGLEGEERMDVSVSVEGTREGMPTRILRTLGAGADGAAAVVTWVEPISGPTHPMALAIDIRSLEDGDYNLTLAVAATDGSRATAGRRFEVDRR